VRSAAVVTERNVFPDKDKTVTAPRAQRAHTALDKAMRLMRDRVFPAPTKRAGV